MKIDDLTPEQAEKLLEFLKPEPPKYCPHTPYPKQEAFLRSKQMEVLFGGSAGPGKSDALLMAALQYVHIPGYAAILFRNTYQDLNRPGALMDRAKEWWEEYPDIRWNSKDYRAHFPSGASISFGYLDGPNDHLNYKGGEYQFIGFDELTEIREQQYRYMLSRLRKPSNVGNVALSLVPLRARATSNPAPNWVRRYFIEEGKDKSKGRHYIPAFLADNVFVDQTSYGEALSKLTEVDRARLQDGDWYAEETGVLFDRSDFTIIAPEDVPEQAFMNTVRYWDLASTEKTEGNDPDYTVGAKVAIVDGYMFILDMRIARVGPDKVEQLVRQTAYEDGPGVKIRMEKDPGQAGVAQISHYGRNVLLGYDFDGNPPTTAKDLRANLWAPKAKRGEVMVVRGDYVTQFLDQAMVFGSSKDVHDDCIDAVSGAFEILTGLKGEKKRKVRLIV